MDNLRFGNESKGSIHQTLELKRWRLYNYIQYNIFHGQGSLKSFLFKMSTHGPISGIDIVKHMQPRGDLERKWFMFDHCKHVQHWTTMGCYVCDPLYYQILTIAICDM